MAVPVNSALDAQIAALAAQPYPWFLPGYSIRLTDPAMYQQFVETYGFGTNVVIGLSPNEAETITGVPIITNPSFDSQSIRPEIFVHPDALNVLGVPISMADEGGTIFISYANALGRYDRVIWKWQCEVVFFAAPVADPGGSGKYEQDVVFWTGDGASNKLIATAFSLATGVIAIWGCGGIDKTGLSQVNFFRHNDPSMAGTQICGIANNPFPTEGVMSFEAGGFRVSPGSEGGDFGNTNNVEYCAIVIRDTTNDNRYLKRGTYLGLAGAVFQAFVTNGSGAVTYFGGIGWTPYIDGLEVVDGSGSYIFSYGSPTTGTLTPNYAGATGLGFFTVPAGAGARVIPVGSVGPITHAWVWNGLTVYKSTDIPGSDSVELAGGGSGQGPSSTMITALGATDFTVGADLNEVNKLYNYMTLCADAGFLAHLLFMSFAGVSTNAPIVVTPIGFTPSVAFARQGSPIFTAGGLWRAFTQAITALTSIFCGVIGTNNNNDTDGITDIGVDSITLGVQATGIVPGDPFWGWAWAPGSFDVGGGSGPAGPPYNPILIQPGEFSPNGGLLIGSGLGLGHTGPCGCSLLE